MVALLKSKVTMPAGGASGTYRKADVDDCG
jgi:hypothetical protein